MDHKVLSNQMGWVPAFSLHLLAQKFSFPFSQLLLSGLVSFRSMELHRNLSPFLFLSFCKAIVRMLDRHASQSELRACISWKRGMCKCSSYELKNCILFYFSGNNELLDIFPLRSASPMEISFHSSMSYMLWYVHFIIYSLQNCCGN